MIKKLFANLIRHCYIYLSLVAIAIISSVYWTNFINMPRGKETVSLFLCTYTRDLSKFRELLNQNKPSHLREINVINIYPNDRDFPFYFSNRGLNVADMFILPTDKLTEELETKQFAKLDNNVIKDYITSYELDTLSRGIKIHGVGDDDRPTLTFNNQTTNDMDYYIFYRSNSIHCGRLYSESEDDVLLTFTRAIFNNG